MAKTVNLFAAGTKVKETAKKPEKKLIPVPVLDGKIKKFLELKATIKGATAEMKMVEGDIKTAGKEIFMKEYRNQKSIPDNFNMQDKTGAAVMLIVQDKYTLVEAEKLEVLQKFDGLISENVVYKIDPEMVEKYGEILSNMIMKSKDIAADDKPRLITGELTYSVAKGSIDRLLNYENPEMIFQLINPIVALK